MTTSARWSAWPVLLLVLAAGAGCRPSKPLPPDAILVPVRLQRAVLQRTEQIRNARGEMKVELFSEEGYSPFSMVAVAERPAKLHLEALSPFDVPLGVLTTDGDRFQLYALDEGVFYHGPASPENIARLLPLPLPPGDLVNVLLGTAPMLPRPDRVEWDDDEGHYLLWLSFPDGPRQVLRIDPKTLAVRASRVETGDGELVYQLWFEDFEQVEALRLPRRIRFEMPAREIELTLQWKDREINQDIPEEAWIQYPPRGATVKHLP